MAHGSSVKNYSRRYSSEYNYFVDYNHNDQQIHTQNTNSKLCSTSIKWVYPFTGLNYWTEIYRFVDKFVCLYLERSLLWMIVIIQ